VERDLYQKRRRITAKTVDTFARLCGRKLWLIHGRPPTTDGYRLVVPLGDPRAVRWTQRLLAHIVFQTNPTALALFRAQYAEKIERLAENQREESPDAGRLRELLDHMVGLLEVHRVESWWVEIFPGSFDALRRLACEQALPYTSRGDLLVLLSCVEASLPPPPRLLRFLPTTEQAFRMVYQRGPDATIPVAKWLLMRWVDQHLGLLAATASVAQRVQALREVVNLCQTPTRTMMERARPLTAPTRASRNTLREAERLVSEVFATDLGDERALKNLAHRNDAAMHKIVARARSQFPNRMGADDLLRSDTPARVLLQDASLEGTPTPLDTEDRALITRLRQEFARVMGRRQHELRRSGLRVSLQAVIQQRATGQPRPIFRAPRPDRGFRAVLLLDWSASMQGEKSDRAVRAGRIIQAALDYPFVEFEVWLVCSPEAGTVSVLRVPRRLPVQNFVSFPVDGLTPLHLALRLAVTKLAHVPEAKYLAFISDGVPEYKRRNGEPIPSEQLQIFVREELQRAHRYGIYTGGLLVNPGLPLDRLRAMLGPTNDWWVDDEERFGDGLIRLVVGGFTRYLAWG